MKIITSTSWKYTFLFLGFISFLVIFFFLLFDTIYPDLKIAEMYSFIHPFITIASFYHKAVKL